MGKMSNIHETGVVGVICSCCARTILIINRDAYHYEPEFCRSCMELPPHEAEAIIVSREEACKPAKKSTHIAKV